MINQLLVWLYANVWVIQVFAIVLVTLILHFVENRIYRKLYPKLQQTRSVWDNTLLESLHKPLALLIWILGISFAATIIGIHTQDDSIPNAAIAIRKYTVLVLTVWFLVRFITKVEKQLIAKNVAAKKGLDPTTIHALGQIFRASLFITGSLIVLQMYGVPISGIWAFGGIGGIAVGFAAKDLLANFFGGLMIYLDRPFSVGDWIRSPEKEIEGTVEHIGWRLTRIRTFDKRPLFVPNGVFSTISVENPTRMTHRRIKAIINLRYDDANKIKPILRDINDMLHNHPDIDTEQTIMVNLVECASWSLNFMVYAFTKTVKRAEFLAVQQDIFIKILEIVAAHKAECAFPTSTVHMPNGIAMHST